MPTIPALWKLRQEDHKFEAYLSNLTSSCHTHRRKGKKQEINVSETRFDSVA